MIARFYDGGVEGGGGIIDAERAIAEARPGRIEVRECSHDRRGAGPRNTIIGGDQADVADLIAHEIVRKAFDDEDVLRSEERRVGKECVSPCRCRWWPYDQKKKTR